jgi:hypothetical protein
MGLRDFNLYYVPIVTELLWENNGWGGWISHQWGFIERELSGTVEANIEYITAGAMHEGRQRWRKLWKRNL